MNFQDFRVAEFLELEEANHGKAHRQLCERLLQDLPDGDEFHPFNISSRASLQAQEDSLRDCPAINATPFDSRRD